MNVPYDRNRAVTVFPGEVSRDLATPELIEEWRPGLLTTLTDVIGEDAFAMADRSLAAEQAVAVCCSLASWHAYGCPDTRYLIGHSLGEITALVAAGSIAEDDAVRLAALRGELISRACDASPGCGMVSVRAALFDIEAVVESCGLAVAYHTAPRHSVLSGSRDALERAKRELSQLGIRCTPMPARGAFNSTLMQSAVGPLRAALEQCEVRPPHALVYSATTCRPLIDVRSELANNIAGPVRWWETLARLAMEGVETFLEVSVGGLITPLPAGILNHRAEQETRPSADEVVVTMTEAEPSLTNTNREAMFVYFDDQNQFHLLV